MIKDNDFHFDNIKPNRQTFDSKKINFLDKNDLLENEEKIQTVSFAKKATLFFSVLTKFLLNSRLISSRGLPQTDDCSFCDV